MPRHWESSRKPLFIKTIWKDGQHHVILNENEANHPEKESFSNGWPYSRKSRAAKSSTGASTSNIKVASLKLYVDINSSNINFVRCKTSLNISRIEQTESSSSRLNVIKRHKSAASYKKLCLPFKYNSIDLLDSNKAYQECREGSKWIECNPIGATNQDSNVLSDRVLVWLDLALQNINGKKYLKPVTEKLISVPTDQEKLRILKNHKSESLVMKERSNNVKNLSDNFHIVPEKEVLRTCSHFSDNYSVKENTNEIKSNSKNENQSLLSCFEENNFQMPTISCELSANKLANMKRQIHIFMPDLKSNPDGCESSLLQKIGCSFRNCPMLYV